MVEGLFVTTHQRVSTFRPITICNVEPDVIGEDHTNHYMLISAAIFLADLKIEKKNARDTVAYVSYMQIRTIGKDKPNRHRAL